MTIASPAPTKPIFGEKIPKKRQETDSHNQNTQSMRKPISIVLFMPLVLRFIEFAFFQLIFFIFRSVLGIKETHKGTVRHKRHNSFGFIIPEFQAAYPSNITRMATRIRLTPNFWEEAASVSSVRNSFCQFRFHNFYCF